MDDKSQTAGTDSGRKATSPRLQAWLAFFSGVMFTAALLYLSVQAEQCRSIIMKSGEMLAPVTALTLKVAHVIYFLQIPLGVLFLTLASLPVLHVHFFSGTAKPAGAYRFLNYLFVLLIAGVLLMSGSLNMTLQEMQARSARSKALLPRTKDGLILPTMPGLPTVAPTTPSASPAPEKPPQNQTTPMK